MSVAGRCDHSLRGRTGAATGGVSSGRVLISGRGNQRFEEASAGTPSAAAIAVSIASTALVTAATAASDTACITDVAVVLAAPQLGRQASSAKYPGPLPWMVDYATEVLVDTPWSTADRRRTVRYHQVQRTERQR